MHTWIFHEIFTWYHLAGNVIQTFIATNPSTNSRQQSFNYFLLNQAKYNYYQMYSVILNCRMKLLHEYEIQVQRNQCAMKIQGKVDFFFVSKEQTTLSFNKFENTSLDWCILYSLNKYIYLFYKIKVSMLCIAKISYMDNMWILQFHQGQVARHPQSTHHGVIGHSMSH